MRHVKWEKFKSSQCSSHRGHTDYRRMQWDGKGWGNYGAIWTRIPHELRDAIVQDVTESNVGV